MEIDVIDHQIKDINPDLMKILLSDKTTKSFIRWGSDNYAGIGPEYQADQEIRPDLVTGKYAAVIQPRVLKSEEEKNRRTREKGEVFTPSWVCNDQNNLIDAAWFGRNDVFNKSSNKAWVTVPYQIRFPHDKTWKEYVDARRMEISCGEAPYLVSRYDTVSGEPIPVKNRIGLLDRKLRIVGENAANEEEWMIWVFRAFQSCYGYDFQGDNILLARKNLLYTFVEYMEERWNRKPSQIEMKKIANIVSWNIWQMNGLTMTAPYSTAEPVYEQITLYSLFGIERDEEGEENTETEDEIPCRIYDWRANESIEFRSIIREG